MNDTKATWKRINVMRLFHQNNQWQIDCVFSNRAVMDFIPYIGTRL